MADGEDEAMVTLHGFLDPNPWLKDACREFCSIERSGYNMLKEGMEGNEAAKALEERSPGVAFHWRQSATVLASAVLESQKEQLITRMAELEWKISKAQLRLQRTANPLKRSGIEKRIQN